MFEKQKYINRLMFYNGTKEYDVKHKEIVAIYNSIIPVPQSYYLKLKDPWCAGFISAVAWEVGARGAEFPFECSVERMRRKASQLKLQQIKSTPMPGDIIFYDWTNNNWYNHVGVCIYSETDGINVIEGNYSNKVGIRSLNWAKPTNSRIQIWRPIYGLHTPSETIPSLEQLITDIIKGKYGNGKERAAKVKEMGYSYTEVRKLVNARMKEMEL